MRIGFLLYDGVEELDLVGPWEMTTMWAKYADGPDAIMVAAQQRHHLCAKGMILVPHHDFADCPALDYLLVPGGFAALDVVGDGATIDFVRRSASRATALLSVCTGAFILHAAGLLAGRDATTHWKFVDTLGRLPDVTLRHERWVRDGPIWTSAGVSAGIDMMLAFIADEAGPAAAATVQLHSEYFPASNLYGDVARDPRLPAYLRRRASGA